LHSLISDADVKHLPAYAPIHEARLVASLDKLQDGKRALGSKDTLTVDIDGFRYEVDLMKTWTPEAAPITSETQEKHSEAEIIITIRKPDLLGDARWQFTHGGAVVSASIKDELWLKKLHDRKIALHSGDALQCRVLFTYIFDSKALMIEQKTDILEVIDVLKGDGAQLSFL
jgi:hypothetical protein